MDDGTGTPFRLPGLGVGMPEAAPCPPAAIEAPRGLCVFSGGTAANSLVDAFQAVATFLGAEAGGGRAKPCALTYIIPISDNGGSSSELIRFFGGPSVGDIRSRLVRLIPTGDEDDRTLSATATSSRAALRALMEHRLCTSDPRQARAEWLDLVEARHMLWTFVPGPTRELIRAVLNTLNLEIVKRVRPTSVFNFAGASVGNLFLTGARLFSGSFEAAIYLLSLLCGIPDDVAVLPAISSNFTHHISAGLADGSTIAGQVNISHPSAPTSLPDGVGAEVAAAMATATSASTAATAASTMPPTPLATRGRAATAVDFEDATLPGSLPVLRRPQIAFSKEEEEDLPARIERVWYINPYGHEIRPPANPKAVAALRRARAIIYSIGSLYTSIVPSLVLRGVGAAIEEDESEGEDEEEEGAGCGRPKVLILNSRLDRETGPHGQPMTAVDFVRAIAAACRQSQQDVGPVTDEQCRRCVTHVVHLAGPSAAGGPAEGGPAVDAEALGRLGVQCVSVARQAGDRGIGRYDEEALTGALQRIVAGTC